MHFQHEFTGFLSHPQQLFDNCTHYQYIIDIDTNGNICVHNMDNDFLNIISLFIYKYVLLRYTKNSHGTIQ